MPPSLSRLARRGCCRAWADDVPIMCMHGVHICTARSIGQNCPGLPLPFTGSVSPQHAQAPPPSDFVEVMLRFDKGVQATVECPTPGAKILEVFDAGALMGTGVF